MSICPFWSNQKEKINCYNECPMRNGEEGKIEEEECIFNSCSESDGDFDIIDNYKSLFKSNLNDEENKIINL